jgi:DNA-binding beta-propeller fold protein YncE
MDYLITGKFTRLGVGLLISLAATAAAIHLASARAAEPKQTAPPKYLSPIAMIADKAGKTIYIAQETAGSVALFDVASRKVTATIDIGPPVSGLAISADETMLYVTAGGAKGKLCVIDIKNRKIAARIPIGHTPTSPVPTANGKVYVCSRFAKSVGLVDLAAGKETRAFHVPSQPVSADLSKDGSMLLVANHRPVGPASAKHVAADVSVMYTDGKRDPVRIKLPNGSTSLRSIRVSPDGKYAAVTHTLARSHVPITALESGPKNTNAISMIDVASSSLIETILTDGIQFGAANSWALAWSSDSKKLCVTHAGSHEMSIIDIPLLEAKLRKVDPKQKDKNVRSDPTFLNGLRERIKLPGKGPRCVTIIGDKAFVGEYFTDSLSIVDISPKGKKAKRRIESIALGPKTAMTAIRRGEMLFNNAGFQTRQSCATCHPGGRTDGMSWDLQHDGIGNPKSTKSLLGAFKTPPSMLTGVRANAMIAVRQKMRRPLFTVQPEKNALAIDAYLKSLEPAPSPHLVNGKLSRAALRGRILFHGKAKCASCHSGELFTDQEKHNVNGKAFDTPTLIEVWRTAPYLYRGQAATMFEALSRKHNPRDLHGETLKLTDKERADLAEYVLSL